jgi:hypothetical protein
MFGAKKGPFAIAENLKPRDAGKEGEIGGAHVDIEGGECLEYSWQAMLGPKGFQGRIVVHAAQNDSRVRL